MMKLIGAAVVAVVSLAGVTTSAQADSKPRKVTEVAPTVEHRSSSTYRRGPQVRGFVQRRGGYSYGASDSVNTYGDARTRYGSNRLIKMALTAVHQVLIMRPHLSH